MTPDKTTAPLVILCLEAGEAALLEQWAHAGFLPTIAGIMQRGSSGRLTGPELVNEHGVWVSLFSGLSRDQHGYYYWRPLKPGTYELELTDLGDISALPFWSCLRGSSKKAAIIDPSESRLVSGLPGLQLANWAPHNARYAACSEPASLLPELRERFGQEMAVEEDVDSDLARDREIYRGLLKQIAQKGALCRDVVRRDRFDLIAITFLESHIAGHQFLKYCSDVRGPAAIEDAELSDAIRNIYQAIDKELGLLLADASADANVFVVSNVGLQEDYPSRQIIEAFCRELGYQVPAKSGSFSFRALARRALPAALRNALSGRLARSTRERLLADGFRTGTDWQKTTAFAIPTLYTSFLRVNLRGREPQGIVEPREYDSVLDRLQADLEQLIDPQSNRPAVKRIERSVDLFGGGPPFSLPDLFVEWTPTAYIKRTVVHPQAVLIQRNLDYSRGSHHTYHGFLAAAGPSIGNRGSLGNIEILDLAPTFLQLMNENVPSAMRGTVNEKLCHL